MPSADATVEIDVCASPAVAMTPMHNTKTPILRMALSTVILVDPSLVITDMARRPSDYGRMGLPINDRSMHYEQPDGWVHAVDLRTKSSGEIRNLAVQIYFEAMGFSTLRHVGTADHLHVQMRRLS